MRRFLCPDCGNEVYFDNLACVACQTALGYRPEAGIMSRAGDGGARPCANRQQIGCNWVLEHADPSGLCMSCSLTTTIPDLSVAGNVERWARLERAKRRLVYSILGFGLPLPAAQPDNRETLRFDFKGDAITRDGKTERVLTGHDNGLITLNIAEADDAVREKNRVALHEPYRTLVGHFRHEVGHYYWDRLVADRERSEAFRWAFGDERADYGEALERHYEQGAPADWPQRFISHYASSHPWEDFAETWAHYFHIVDALETAAAYELPTLLAELDFGEFPSPYRGTPFHVLLKGWIPVTVAMNEMNRSVGQPDFYPFVLTNGIAAKLAFVHALIQDELLPAPDGGGTENR
ncbi:MAG: putative zinc-binding metallopeptidase [Flavobacteriaceae bacterium]